MERNRHGLRETIYSARVQRGWSRERLATEATALAPEPIDERQIMRLECRNVGIPSADVLRPVAEALAIDLEEVFARLGYF